MASGPGPVAAAHRLLIVSGLLCALAYAGWELRQWAAAGETAAVIRAGLAGLAALGLGAYLRSLRGLGAKLTPRVSGDRRR
jgi:hypothetical protein